MPARISATICDDLRREDNGKIILIGGYSGGLGAFDFPVEDTFTCMIRGDSLPVGAQKLTFYFRHISFPVDKKELDVEGLNGGAFLFALREIPIRAKGPGDFFIEASIDGGRKKKIEKLSIFDARDEDVELGN